MAIMGRQLGVAAPPQAAADHQTAVATFQSAGGSGPEPSPPNGAINLDNILALIPGEVVPIYIAGGGIQVEPIHNVTWTVVVFWICFFLCAVLRGQASKPPGANGIFSGVNWRLVLVSLVAFFVWAHAVSATGHGPLVTSLPSAAWGFIAMVLGVLAPLAVPSAPNK